MSAIDWVKIAVPVIKEIIGVSTFLIPEPKVPEIHLLKESEEAEVNTERIHLIRKLLDEVKEGTPCPSCVDRVVQIDKDVAVLEKQVVTQERVARLRENLQALLEDAHGDISALGLDEQSIVQRGAIQHNATVSTGNVGVATPSGEHKPDVFKPVEQVKSRPETGKTSADQTDESLCFECAEGHFMKAQTEARHAVDRGRTAGKITPGVVEKVRVALAEISGIDEDVKNVKGASPNVSKGLSEILDGARWIRKEYGLGGKGLTAGQGTIQDLEQLRYEISVLQDKTYKLVGQCPTCLKRIR